VPEPVWLDLDVVLAIHHNMLTRFGGGSGLRDLGLLESALARPKWLYEFDPAANPHRLAAACAFGIAKNHPFVDGNKRVAFICAYVFLRFHGWHIIATQREVEHAMLALADGSLNEVELAAWLEEKSEPVSLQSP
jgi:death on curing protein